jgi:23S rRNA (cytosine1962-C5)-methyltransferase
VPKALTAYQRLTTLGLALVERDGLLVQASCSSRVTEPDFARAVHTAAAAAGYDLEEVARTGHALDHPISFPEGGYLKAIFARPHRIKRL